MKIDNINVDNAVQEVKVLLAQEAGLSPALRSAIEIILVLVTLLLNRLTLTSRNSSKPPSSDPNRDKKRSQPGDKKPGGQKGRSNQPLQPVDDPDDVQILSIERQTLPEGSYRQGDDEVRPVIDIDISRFVTEYRAEVLLNDAGERFVAPFPAGVNAAVQYGRGIKVNAVYQSQFQLVPYNRVEDYFAEQLHIPLSTGSIDNFIEEAYQRLEPFEQWLVETLRQQDWLHADETSLNIGGKKHWLHCSSNTLFTYYTVHAKRGKEAMDDAGGLPFFKGTLVHDHWKPYYRYDQFLNALCNAHHLRELERAWEQDRKQWAYHLKALLLESDQAVTAAGGKLSQAEAQAYRRRYRELLAQAETESPPPDEANRKKGQRGRLKRTKARSLLERLRDFEDDVLRFMENEHVPFTNNQGENDIRMTKLHQKISGCFRSMKGAEMFCRIRSYLSTCRKNSVSSSEALNLLFQGQWPAFVKVGAE